MYLIEDKAKRYYQMLPQKKSVQMYLNIQD